MNHNGYYNSVLFQDKNGNLDGIDAQLLQRMAKILGVKIVYNTNPGSFDEVTDTVAQGKADIGMGALSLTTQRALYTNFTKPYLLLRRVLLINRIQDLKADTGAKDTSHTIGVLKDSSYINFAKDHHAKEARPLLNGKKFVEYADFSKAFNLLIKGEIYALYLDEATARKLLEEKQSSRLFIREYFFPNETDPISFAVSWKNHSLESWINLFISEQKYNGFQDYLEKKFLKD